MSWEKPPPKVKRKILKSSSPKKNSNLTLWKRMGVSKILFLLSAFTFLAFIGNAVKQAEGAAGFFSSVYFLFGGLACWARREQTMNASKGWLILEATSFIIIGFHLCLSLTSSQNNWYYHPIDHILSPSIVILSWLFTVFKPLKGN